MIGKRDIPMSLLILLDPLDQYVIILTARVVAATGLGPSHNGISKIVEGA